MTNDDIIQKLRGLQRYYITGGTGVWEGTTEGDKDDDGEWIMHDDIEELINELEKPKLFCETVNVQRNHSMSYSCIFDTQTKG